MGQTIGRRGAVEEKRAGGCGLRRAWRRLAGSRARGLAGPWQIRRPGSGWPGRCLGDDGCTLEAPRSRGADAVMRWRAGWVEPCVAGARPQPLPFLLVLLSGSALLCRRCTLPLPLHRHRRRQAHPGSSTRARVSRDLAPCTRSAAARAGTGPGPAQPSCALPIAARPRVRPVPVSAGLFPVRCGRH